MRRGIPEHPPPATSGLSSQNSYKPQQHPGPSAATSTRRYHHLNDPLVELKHEPNTSNSSSSLMATTSGTITPTVTFNMTGQAAPAPTPPWATSLIVLSRPNDRTSMVKSVWLTIYRISSRIPTTAPLSLRLSTPAPQEQAAPPSPCSIPPSTSHESSFPCIRRNIATTTSMP